MSEGPTPEGPTQRIASPQERIDLAALSSQRRADAIIPPFRVDKSLDLSNRLVNAAENIAATNARILTNMDQMTAMFSKFTSDNEKVAQIRDETMQRRTVQGADQPLTITDLDESRQQMALRDFRNLSRTDLTEQLTTLKQRGILDDEGAFRLGTQQHPQERVTEALHRIAGRTEGLSSQPSPEIRDLRKSLESQMEQSSLRTAARQELTINQRLQEFGLGVLNRFIPQVGAHAAGIPHGVVSPRVPTTIAGGVAAEGAVEGSAFAGAGAVTRLLSAGGAVGLLSRAVPMLAPLLIAQELLPRIKQYIPGFAQFQQISRAGIAAGQMGAVTGEGMGAGFAAMGEARGLRGGILGSPFHSILHPFDPITNQIAQEIVMSVRTQGFTGRQGRAFEREAASLYRDLRLPVDQTTQLLADAVRTGGESLQQIAKEMHTFDDAAHNLQMGITDYAAAVTSASKQLRDAGAGAAATQFAQSLIASVPRMMRTPEGLQQVTASMQAAAPFITSQTGIPPWLQGLAANIPQTRAAYQNTLQQQFRLMPGRTPEEKAAAAAQFSPVFRGQSIPAILQMMDRIRHGRGPGSVALMEQARTRYAQRLTHETGGAMSMDAQHLFERGREWAQLHGVGDAEWERIQHEAMQGKSTRFRVRGAVDMSRVSTPHLESMRRDLLRQVSPTLTDEQRKMFQRHLTDRGFSFNKHLTDIEARRGRFTGGSSVDVNGVTITLKGKAEKLLQLNAPNKERAYRGYQPMNSSFPTENSRLDTGF